MPALPAGLPLSSRHHADAAATGRPRLDALCVFCGSSDGLDPAYRTAARGLGAALAGHGAALVWGGGRAGIMGAVCDGARAAGGRTIGVIPDFLKDKELAHPDATEMVVVPDMHTRKRAMFERADAFCILPGGLGTMDEAFEIITWKQLHLHNKPIVLLNIGGYWAHLLALIDAMTAQGFAHHGHEALITVVAEVGQVIPAVERELAEPKPLVRFPGVRGV